jgi:hypothetical protein
MQIQCVSLAIILAASIAVPAGAQSTSAPAQRDRGVETYDALQAGQNAYRAAEAQRQAAIDRQLQVQDEIRWYNSWAPGYGDGPTLTEIYAYGSPRAYRRAQRQGYGPLFEPWPRVPGDIYGSSYYGYVRQPTGHEKIWTSPNGYIYRPRYDRPPSSGEPALPAIVPPASRAPSRGVPPAPPGGATPIPPPPTPGVVPPPSVNSAGPREL